MQEISAVMPSPVSHACALDDFVLVEAVATDRRRQRANRKTKPDELISFHTLKGQRDSRISFHHFKSSHSMRVCRVCRVCRLWILCLFTVSLQREEREKCRHKN